MDFEFSVILESIPALLAGAKLTWIITLLGIFGGMIFGILAGLGRIAGTESLGEKPHGLYLPFSALIRKISAGYVETVRGTPIIVQAMFLYFAFPMLVKALTDIERFRIEAVTAAVITIMINAGAYIAEIVRGSVLSVNKGLLEAGMSLGINRFQLIFYIIGPIAFRRMIPPLGNQFIISLKDTSLFIVIGVGELTRQGQEIMASNFRALEIWLTVAVMYLAMTTVLAVSLRKLEQRMKIY
ncbi:MAG: ABC transporter permease subunit [Deltaproteobacteria bacterium]|nr:ABC transporter permease subunit [Deltaproteobacteria bacterium]NCP02658.1 ABC transporter permease subunit [Deltaproteobacteria bacterium]